MQQEIFKWSASEKPLRTRSLTSIIAIQVLNCMKEFRPKSSIINWKNTRALERNPMKQTVNIYTKTLYKTAQNIK